MNEVEVGEKIKKPGNDLLSHEANLTVPSALKGLTSEFGMGSGVSPSLKSPGKIKNKLKIMNEEERVKLVI